MDPDLTVPNDLMMCETEKNANAIVQYFNTNLPNFSFFISTEKIKME